MAAQQSGGGPPQSKTLRAVLSDCAGDWRFKRARGNLKEGSSSKVWRRFEFFGGLRLTRLFLRAGKGHFEGEDGAVAGAFAVNSEGAAEFFGGDDAAVQAEAVAVFARGEAL